MKISPHPSNEINRLRALRQLQILDTEAEKDFDDIVKLASVICNTKMSLIGLIDEDRQWYKAKVGVNDKEVKRELSFCSHAIHGTQVMVVPDARYDERFHDHPFVSADPGIRFYAGVPLRTSEGFALGTLCVFDHIPSRLSDDQLLSLTILGNQVMKLLDLRTKVIEVKDARRRAEEATKAKSSFLSVMSHEIRTPMNAMVGLTNLLIEDNPTDGQREYLNLLKFSSENLLRIINDILDFSKIEANKVEIETIAVDLGELLANIVKMFRIPAHKKNIALNYTLDKNVPPIIKSDPLRLTQILTNMVSNAIKFTEKGSVTLSVSCLASSNNHHEVKFEVTDTGIGIAPDKLEIIFDSFSQANFDTTRKFGGTGLGLAISKNILSLMHSKFSVQSTLGKGSSFSFVLNVVGGEKERPAEAGVLENLNCKILVVDDNAVNQIVAQRFLKKWNVSTRVASSGTEALSIVDNESFDLILMDVQMPDIDGFETTKRIREKGIKTPVIALTASSIEEIKDEVDKSGMVDFIPKPFEQAEMHQTISKHL